MRLAIFLQLRPESEVLLITAVVALVVAPSVQIAYQWERAVILRFGRFKALRKSGLFLIVPIIDKVAQFVDQRVRVTDFSAETTLTADTVPVNVDAIAFWMVWDAQKAVLEVEHFDDAVIMSAQTALRNAIGKNDLADLLSERDRLGHEVQKVLDEKTSAGGSPPRPSRSATSSSRRVSRTRCRGRRRPSASGRAESSSARPRPRSPRSSP